MVTTCSGERPEPGVFGEVDRKAVVRLRAPCTPLSTDRAEGVCIHPCFHQNLIILPLISKRSSVRSELLPGKVFQWETVDWRLQGNLPLGLSVLCLECTRAPYSKPVQFTSHEAGRYEAVCVVRFLWSCP